MPMKTVFFLFMRVLRPEKALSVIAILWGLMLTSHAQVQYLNKDYRTAVDGNYSVAGTWETNVTVAGGWVAANVGPSSSVVGIIEITNGRTITTSANGTAVRLVVDPGGVLTMANNIPISAGTDASYTNALGVVDSADLIVAGTVNLNGGTLTINSSATAIVESNGVIQLTSSSSSAPLPVNGTL